MFNANEFNQFKSNLKEKEDFDSFMNFLEHYIEKMFINENLKRNIYIFTNVKDDELSRFFINTNGKLSMLKSYKSKANEIPNGELVCDYLIKALETYHKIFLYGEEDFLNTSSNKKEIVQKAIEIIDCFKFVSIIKL